jgi:hypothetical protein
MDLCNVPAMTRRRSHLALSSIAGALAPLWLTPPAWAAAAAKPAGGAAVGEVVIATAGATILTAGLLALGTAHRSGRTQILRRAAERASRIAGLPPWAALPSWLASASLLVALFGMYWDISLHIDVGRDPGPLANPAHYFILAGLFGIFAAGYLAVVLPDGRPSRSAVRITGDWYAPVGGLVLLACSSFSLLGFPLDDVWHRMFGQDVTLWGPTHLMLIGGAGLALIGNAALMVEGRHSSEDGHAREHRAAHGVLAFLERTRYAAVCGGLLIGLSTFQAEFDFGVPQFRLLFQPLLIAVAAAIALVAARIYAGRGGALWAAAYFIAIRGTVTLLVGPVLGETTPHLPLYLAEAGLVELAALAVGTQPAYRFGAIAGLLVGTVGTAAEWGWSHVWMPLPWPSSMLGQVLATAPVAAVAGGLVGAFLGSALAAPRRPVAIPRLMPAVAALAVIAALIGYGLDTHASRGVSASVTLTDVRPGPEREAQANVRIEPASAAADAQWLTVTAWQGGGLVVDRLERTGPDSWRTTRTIPMHGDWKTTLRLQKDDAISAVPIYLPADPAIPAPGVAAASHFSRQFVSDRSLLQRERKQDVPAALPAVGYGAVLSIALTLIAFLAWALLRLARRAREGEPPVRPAPRGFLPPGLQPAGRP